MVPFQSVWGKKNKMVRDSFIFFFCSKHRVQRVPSVALHLAYGYDDFMLLRFEEWQSFRDKNVP